MDITSDILSAIKNTTPITFAKFGDGEYNCMFSATKGYGSNCDRDNYTSALSESLRNAFKYMVNRRDCYIGKWHTEEVIGAYRNYIGMEVNNYADYHSLIILSDKVHEKGYLNQDKVEIYKAIKNSRVKKIMICNSLMAKAQSLLEIDCMIYVPFNNWFDTQFQEILAKVMEQIVPGEPHIVLTCCGMSSKVLIYELLKRLDANCGIYLDIGSALDFLCTKKDSRGWQALFNYEYLLELFKDLLPADWNDAKYDEIYRHAKYMLGTHLN